MRRPSYQTSDGVEHGLLKPAYVASTSVAVLLSLVSIIGLVDTERIYPTQALQELAVPNDLVSLFFGVPLLVGSMWLARRGTLIGRLSWPGALMYVLYGELAYIFCMPMSWIYLAYLTIGVTSLYTLIGLMSSIDTRFVQQQIAGKVPARFSGGVLIVFGGLTFGRVFVVLAGALAEGTTISTTQLAVLLSDLLLSPAWIIGGVLLWKLTAFGYSAGLGLLFQASMLFVGLIMILMVQPWLTDAPFVLFDVIVVAILGLICFIPLALFLRAARESLPHP